MITVRPRLYRALDDGPPDGSRLLVRSHGGGSVLRVGNVLAHDAAWMPDGESILYAVGSELRVFRLADGSTVRYAALSGRAFWMRWSPDGQTLRFTELDPLSHSSSLWQIAQGGRPKPLLRGWTSSPGECCGAWTSDGGSFVFASSRAGGSDLWRLRGTDTEPRSS